MQAATLNALKNQSEYFWVNPDKCATEVTTPPTLADIQEADARLRRFDPFFKAAFDDVTGLIESPLSPLEHFKLGIIPFVGGRVLGDWFLKRDDLLPISGSVKARGGVYEIVTWAEQIALESGHLKLSDDYSCLLTPPFQDLFNQYTVYVGSTGNLGLSIGTISRALGFNVTVHMSSDAKPWKMDRLRALGATVVLHETDYSAAVTAGRDAAALDPKAYFVDDENSETLFIGYGVAALRLKDQLAEAGTVINSEKPLFLYLPCGVGGAPGGIAHAAKLCFGANVYLFFAEPTGAPCMLYGMASGKHGNCHIDELGLDGHTVADGLAVGRPSGFVGQLMAPILDGIYTVSDDKMQWLVHLLNVSENIQVEPSATAGLLGPIKLFYTQEGFEVLLKHNLLEKMTQAVHISWATGGSLVPADAMAREIEKGKAIQMTAL